MSVSYGTVLKIDSNNTDSLAQSFAECLPATDSLQSCTVAVVSGTIELSPTAFGPWSGSEAAATILGNKAVIWYRSAVDGAIELRFRGTTHLGRQIDLTETVVCESR